MPTTDWCLGKPYTNYNNGVCSCVSGYVNVNGLCVSAWRFYSKWFIYQLVWFFTYINL